MLSYKKKQTKTKLTNMFYFTNLQTIHENTLKII